VKPAALLTALALGVSGCSSPGPSKDPNDVAVSVSAVNYSQLSNEDLYARVYAPANYQPEPPAPVVSFKPLYYLMVPGEVYPSDVPIGSVYHELELALEPRRYFNVIYQMRAGHTPPRIDYILRVHYGGRKWQTPIVRPDRITWGNDGMVSRRYMSQLASNSLFDPRVGLTADEALRMRGLFAMPMGGSPGIANGQGTGPITPAELTSAETSLGAQPARDFCLIMVEAFKFEDVKALDRNAPCIWATFVAVPDASSDKFSSLLRPMLTAASPYFGTTTNGLQVYDVPLGKVLLGNPVEVAPPAKGAARQLPDDPAVHFRP
jgi:hypothetical protein